MTEVEVRDDPGHPEGGYVVIALRGGGIRPGPARLHIELLTEGARYSGPRDLDVTGVARGDGAIVYSVADGLLDTMPTGTGVQIAIAGTAAVAETVWPELTLRKADGRRGGFRTRPARQVETPVDKGPRRPTVTGQPLQDGASAGGTRPLGNDMRPGVGDPVRDGAGVSKPTATAPHGAQTGMTKLIDPPETGSEGTQPRVDGPPLTPRRRAAWLRNVTIAVAGLGIGVAGGWGLSAAYRPTRPPSGPDIVPAPVALALPSPFADLEGLPTISPNGVDVQGSDWVSFLTRATKADDPAESSFWLKWAMRAMLKARRADVGRMFTEYAVEIAQVAHGDPNGLAEAGLLWELAATAGDCAALTNLSLAFPGRNWSGLAAQCEQQRRQTQ